MAKKSKLNYASFDFEIKQLPDEDDGFFRFEGLASTFGNMDLVDDIVERGAFLESIAKFKQDAKSIKILWQHSSFEPLGIFEIMEETETGLFVRGRLPIEDTLVKGRVMPQMRLGTIDSMSIGFRLKEGDFEVREGIRFLTKIDLVEVSLVTFPANPMATVFGVKNEDFKKLELDDVKNFTVREFEKTLRDSGLFSKKASVFLASKSNFDQGEPEEDENANELTDQCFSSLINKVNEKQDELDLNMLLKKVNNYANSP